MAKLKAFRQESRPGMKRFYVNDLDTMVVGWENGHPILRIDSLRTELFSPVVTETLEVIFIGGQASTVERFVERLFESEPLPAPPALDRSDEQG